MGRRFAWAVLVVFVVAGRLMLRTVFTGRTTLQCAVFAAVFTTVFTGIFAAGFATATTTATAATSTPASAPGRIIATGTLTAGRASLLVATVVFAVIFAVIFIMVLAVMMFAIDAVFARCSGGIFGVRRAGELVTCARRDRTIGIAIGAAATSAATTLAAAAVFAASTIAIGITIGVAGGIPIMVAVGIAISITIAVAVTITIVITISVSGRALVAVTRFLRTGFRRIFGRVFIVLNVGFNHGRALVFDLAGRFAEGQGFAVFAVPHRFDAVQANVRRH